MIADQQDECNPVCLPLHVTCGLIRRRGLPNPRGVRSASRSYLFTTKSNNSIIGACQKLKLGPYSMTPSRVICHPATHQPENTATGFSPTRLMEVELTKPLPSIAWDGRYSKVWIVAASTLSQSVSVSYNWVRTVSHPASSAHFSRLTPIASQSALRRGRPARAMRIDSAGLEADPQAWPFLRDRRAVLAEAPLISVGHPMRDRPDQLARCLDHLNRQEYSRFEVIVVENVPTGESAPPACRLATLATFLTGTWRSCARGSTGPGIRA